MEFSVEKWQELCVGIEEFEVEFYARFTCDPEDLTTDKLESCMKTRSGGVQFE